MDVTESAPVCPAKEELETNTLTRAVDGMKAVKNNPEDVKAFELAESVEGEEETDDDTDDESDDGERRQFLQLMNKAERKNEKRVQAPVQTFHQGSLLRSSSRADWRTELGDPESDTTDTEDEDDTVETRRFLSLMGKNKQQENRMVNVSWQGGKMVGLPGGIKVTRVPVSEEVRRRHEQELLARRRAHLEAIRREGPPTTTSSGKRKFEERMTLSEAKSDDFTDTKDFVDFIQAKLKNVSIKIIK